MLIMAGLALSGLLEVFSAGHVLYIFDVCPLMLSKMKDATDLFTCGINSSIIQQQDDQQNIRIIFFCELFSVIENSELISTKITLLNHWLKNMSG